MLKINFLCVKFVLGNMYPHVSMKPFIIYISLLQVVKIYRIWSMKQKEFCKT